MELSAQFVSQIEISGGWMRQPILVELDERPQFHRLSPSLRMLARKQWQSFALHREDSSAGREILVGRRAPSTLRRKLAHQCESPKLAAGGCRQCGRSARD